MPEYNAAGIIAEYNPFHNGHKYQIDRLRSRGVQTVAVALSGDFVQRGAPAWCDKYLRTRMALSQGADLVFELPVVYALSSAEGFALGGVSLLNALPLDTLCFGMETEDLASLQCISDFLFIEDRASDGERTDTPYQKKLRGLCGRGLSYPAARQQALAAFLPEIFNRQPEILSQPNQILALEYLKALRALNSPLHPLALKRVGRDYHDTSLPTDTDFLPEHHDPALCTDADPLPEHHDPALRTDADPLPGHHNFADTHSFPDYPPVSAAAIRQYFSQHGTLPRKQNVLPDSVLALLDSAPGQLGRCLDDFSLPLYQMLRQNPSRTKYVQYGRISPELAARIERLLPQYRNISSFLTLLKTKNITYGNLSRSMMHLLLGITSEELAQTAEPVPYLRLLGMRREKSHLLRSVTSRPVITKTADYRQILHSFYKGDAPEKWALECFEKDLFAADLYRQICFQRTGIMTADEFRQGVILS